MRVVLGLNEIAHRKSAGCCLSQGRQNTDICGIDEPVRGEGGRKGECPSTAETQAEPVSGYVSRTGVWDSSCAYKRGLARKVHEVNKENAGH